MSKSDRNFLRGFSILIATLAILTLLIVGLAWWVYGAQHAYRNPDADKLTGQRLAPVGSSYAGDTGRAAMQAAEAAAAKAAASQVAYGGTTDGKAIYGHLCTSCHNAGVAGAPKLGNQSAWAPRIAQGMDTLIKHAINGYTGPDGNHMPAKGGNPALTDKQVEAAVKWMVSQSK
ncbi:c-type cytochrome [Oleiagrimonas sp. C23AA]|uniref:c-type cytochrome n=1 Tax=Oleiagrimonas sp. C23AA TaxID=2719047 RepID=UPI00141DF7AB|nr:cytochrome c5 family protein [Oleiagrimonas sp. C23AA]